jgi:aspartokinase-like uncharacterized kinase
MTTIVYKLGGSLFNLPDLPIHLCNVLKQRPDTQPLLVVGGGDAANIVRRWDRLFQLGDETAHRLALRAMTLNEELLIRLLPAARHVISREQAVAAWRESAVAVLNAGSFLECEEPRQPLQLPHNWDVTSDSIAAWVTAAWPADELVLLKSTDLGDSISFETASADCHLDRYFPVAAAGLRRVWWVNLRADLGQPCSLVASGNRLTRVFYRRDAETI